MSGGRLLDMGAAPLIAQKDIDPMAADNKTDPIFLDHMPSDLRHHTFYQKRARNRDELLAELKSPHMDYLRKANIVDENGEFITRRVELGADRNYVSAERQAALYRDHATEFVQKLLAAVPADQRIGMAAPSQHLGTRRVRNIDFDPRRPTLTVRHEPWLNVTERKFAEVAAQLGRSHDYAHKIRAEIRLIHLVAGTCPPPGAIHDNRKHKARDFEGVYAAVITERLYSLHEEALTVALERDLEQTVPPVMSHHARLLNRLFGAMTALKLGPSSIGPLRNFFRALSEIVDACHAEFKPP